MLIPRSHAWTRRQRWLVIASAVVALAALGALVYGYERYYRGPSESVFIGTWQRSQAGDSATFVKFGADHTVVGFSDGIGGSMVDFRGSWFAGGTQIFLRYEGRMHVWKILNILPDEFQVHESSPDVSVYKRVNVNPPEASNQTMERTATRRAFVSSIATIFLLRSTLAPGGRRSSCSR
jgi:hypothetical protein